MIIQRLFSSKEQKARVKGWRKAQTGEVEPSSIRRFGKNLEEIKNVSREGNIERSRRDILKGKNLDPLAIKEEQGRTIIYDPHKPLSLEATFKNKKDMNKMLESARKDGYKDAEIELNQVYKEKIKGLKRKKAIKKLGKGALIAGGVVAAGVGAKKLADKKKAENKKDRE